MPVASTSKSSPSSRLASEGASTTSRTRQTAAASSSSSTTGSRKTSGSNATPVSGSRTGTAMGNGAGLGYSSSRKVTLDGVAVQPGDLAATVTRLKSERQRQLDRLAEAEAANRDLRQTVERQRREIDGLKAEANKLKSVLDLTVGAEAATPPAVTEALHAKTVGASAGARERLKKQGVSGESLDAQLGEIELRHHDKDERSKKLIREAIVSNSLLQHMEPDQLDEMAACMYPKTVPSACYVIRQGESGQHLYVCSEGQLEVTQDGKRLGAVGQGIAFGELALLYNCTRTASVKAESAAKLWCLDRTVFQAIMMKAGLEKQNDYVGFLRSVPLLKNLDVSKLNKIADAIEQDSFEAEQYIVREGESGNTFFIIKDGVVKVTQKSHGAAHPQLIRVLKSGDYFGEKALLEEEHRTANCIAETRVEVLTLDRLSFIHLIGDLTEFKEKVYDENRPGNLSVASNNSDEAFSVIELSDLTFEVTLGMGGFGRVELVTWKANPDVAFALKCLKKQHIVQTKQQDHIHSEKNILMSLKSNFVCKLYKTFKDRKYVYMLMEVCLGGELWTTLRNVGNFDEPTAKFIMACVLEAFQHLHEQGIIYRDLKPENLLLDHRGYVRLCDFGFAKKIGHGKKTWTFCGTPEYVSPEIILNKGHSFPADIWQIGVLLFELITGSPPFNAPDSMKIYNVILRGIEAVEFPASMSKAAQGLVKKLCRESPPERLGSGIGGIADIKKHKWFQGYDWTGLSRMSLVPPLSPKVNSPTDSSNFDKFEHRISIPPDEMSGWDKDF